MKKRVLIIDDDEELCEEISQIMQEEGCETAYVNDGLKARRVIEEEEHDLVFLDLKLPGIKGEELLRYINKKKNPPKVIILTASPKVNRLSFSGNENMNEIYGYPAESILSKPFDVERVLQKINNLLKS